MHAPISTGTLGHLSQPANGMGAAAYGMAGFWDEYYRLTGRGADNQKKTPCKASINLSWECDPDGGIWDTTLDYWSARCSDQRDRYAACVSAVAAGGGPVTATPGVDTYGTGGPPPDPDADKQEIPWMWIGIGGAALVLTVALTRR